MDREGPSEWKGSFRRLSVARRLVPSCPCRQPRLVALPLPLRGRRRLLLLTLLLRKTQAGTLRSFQQEVIEENKDVLDSSEGVGLCVERMVENA